MSVWYRVSWHDSVAAHHLISLRNRFRLAIFIGVVCLVLSPVTSYSDVAYEFSGMVGWKIAAVTQVEGDFEGCDFDKKIDFTNGMTLECSTYSYTYSYAPTAVIFFKVVKHKDQEFYMLKAFIGDDIYDMAPQLKQ